MFNKLGTPYANELLPKGFKYPDRYLRISDGYEEHDRIDWDYENANSEGGQLAWELRNIHSEWKNVGNRELIPFAQLMDDAAFFDGNDTSGDPRVICLDLSNKNRTYEFKNFDDWLKYAIEN